MTTPIDLRHAKLVVQRSFANQEQVAQCLNDLKEGLSDLPLLDLLIERGFLGFDQADVIRAAVAQEGRTHEDLELGKRMVTRRLATAAQVQECFAILQDYRKKGIANLPRLGQLLLSKGYVTEDEINLLVESPDELELLDDPSRAARREVAKEPEADPYDVSLLDPSGAPPLAAPPRRAPGGTPPKGVPLAPKLAVPSPGTRATGPEPTPAGGRRAPAPAAATRCAFCGTEIRGDGNRRPCPHCKDVYHTECWTNSGGCTREECRTAAGNRAQALASHDYSAWRQLRPLVGKIAAAAAAVALAVAGWIWFSHDAQYYYELGKSVDKRAKEDANRPWRAADLHLGALAAGEETTATLTTVERSVQIEEKIHYFKIAVDKKADFVEAWYALGVAYFELRKNQEAVESLQKAIDLKPDFVEAMLCMGGAGERLGDPAAAERWYKKCIGINPTLTDAHEMLGILLDTKVEGRREEAAAEYRLVLKTKPGDAPIASRLVQILVDAKKYEEALALIEQVDKLTPGSPELKLKRAQLYFAQGKWAEALQLAESISAERPDAGDALRIQAISLHKLGRGDEAYVVAKKACDSSQDAELSLLTGELALQYGEPDAGIGHLRTAFNACRKPEIVERIGDAFLRMGRMDDAKGAFEELRSIQSSNPRAAFKLALAAAGGTDMVKAAAALKELRGRDTANPDLAAVEARIQRQAGEVGPALARLQAIVAESPKSYYAHLQLGVTLRESGQAPAALDELRNAFALEPDPEALFEIGMTYLALKKDAAARLLMKQYVEKVPFGRNLEKARALLPIGGAAATTTIDADPYAYALKTCNDLIGKLSGSMLPNQNPWLHTSAGLYASCAMAQVLAADAIRSQTASSAAAGYGNILSYPVGTPVRVEYQNAEDERLAGEWVTTLSGLCDALAAVIAKRDKVKTKAADVDRILEDRKSRLDGAATVEWRVAAQAHAVTDLLVVLLRLVDGSDAGGADVDRIQALRAVQLECCSGGLQTLCGELYAAVPLADQLVGAQDRNKLCAEPRRAALRKFEQREAKARTVSEQIRNGAVALCELLALLATNPSLRF